MQRHLAANAPQARHEARRRRASARTRLRTKSIPSILRSGRVRLRVAAESRAERNRDEVKRIALHRASEIGADMEMGYYVDAHGTQWAPQTFVVRELIRAMGYSESMVRHAERVAWWPGTARLRKLVAWRVAIRHMQRELDGPRAGGWAGPLLGAAVEELDRRLAERPDRISTRDLTTLAATLARMFKRDAPADERGTAGSIALGETGFTAIVESIERLPEPARGAARARYRAIADAMRDAISRGLHGDASGVA